MELDMEQDLVPSDDKIKSVQELAQLQLELEASVVEAEEALKEEKKKLAKVQEVDLPTAMRAAGIEKITLSNGAVLKLDEGLSISVGAKIGFVCSWLRKHGHGDIIKRELSVELPKGMMVKDVEAVKKVLKPFKLVPNVAETVHSGTLKALLKEQCEKGADIKLDQFGAFEYTKSLIKLPKD